MKKTKSGIQEVSPPTRIGTNPRETRYPWREWFATKAFVLVRGKHFHGQPHGVAETARQAARRLGVSVSINIDDDRLTIRVNNQA